VIFIDDEDDALLNALPVDAASLKEVQNLKTQKENYTLTNIGHDSDASPKSPTIAPRKKEKAPKKKPQRRSQPAKKNTVNRSGPDKKLLKKQKKQKQPISRDELQPKKSLKYRRKARQI